MTVEAGVQGLRATAAGMVLAYHLVGSTAFGGTADWGSQGVVLFFVVSGYILARRWDARTYARPRAFYLRRFFRIWPLYLLALPAFYAVGAMVPSPLDLAFGQDFTLATFLPYNSTWTLCVEELFYAAFPAWMALYASRGAVPVTVGFGVLSAVWVGSAFAFPSPTDVWMLHQVPSYLLAYGLGTLVAKHGTTLPAWVGAAAVGSFAVAWTAQVLGPLQMDAGAVAYAGVLAAWRGAPVLSSKLAVTVGSWTYPLYLLGQPVQEAASALGPLAVVPVTVAVTVALAAAAHRWVERPFRAVGARIERRWLGRPS